MRFRKPLAIEPMKHARFADSCDNQLGGTMSRGLFVAAIAAHADWQEQLSRGNTDQSRKSAPYAPKMMILASSSGSASDEAIWEACAAAIGSSAQCNDIKAIKNAEPHTCSQQKHHRRVQCGNDVMLQAYQSEKLVPATRRHDSNAETTIKNPEKYRFRSKQCAEWRFGDRGNAGKYGKIPGNSLMRFATNTDQRCQKGCHFQTQRRPFA